MSSKPAERRSIASQLVLLFTPAAALLLLSGLGVFYWMVVRHAFEEDNAVLADKVAALRGDLQARGGPSGFYDELKSIRGGERVPYFVRLLDANAQTLAETPGMKKLLPPEVFPAPQSATSSGWKPNDVRVDRRLFSLAVSIEEIRGQRYTIQVAQDRAADEEFTKEFGVLLAVVLAVGVVASAVIGVTVTRRGLRPLAEMTGSLKRASPAHLNERLSAESWPRELQPLAAAFDGMLDRLEESFTRLSQFSADLAHELRTPIANIRGEAEVALTRTRTADEYREVIESTVAECERLSGMIDNLLFLARAEGAERQVNRSTFDGRAAIEKIAAYYEPMAEERQVAIRCAGEGEIYADPILFGRAASNLVNNALRFTGNGGEIVMSISADPGQSGLSVKDNGCGIAAQHLSRVFDRFYRADSSRNSEGTGLGLAIVKSIADLHGGSANVESSVGQGTTVTLKFPSRTR